MASLSLTMKPSVHCEAMCCGEKAAMVCGLTEGNCSDNVYSPSSKPAGNKS